VVAFLTNADNPAQSLSLQGNVADLSPVAVQPPLTPAPTPSSGEAPPEKPVHQPLRPLPQLVPVRPAVDPRYIAGLLATIIGIQIALALAILFKWFPILQAEPNLFTNPDLLFPFIEQHQGQWRGAMFAGVMTSAIAVPLCVYLTRYFSKDEAADEAALFVGVGGFMFDIAATVMSFLGTLWLAREYNADPSLASYVFRWSEAWRDEGLKTISFLAIGLFTLRIAWLMRKAPRSSFIQTTSWLFGLVMLVIGTMDALGRFDLGEYGVVSGFGHILYSIWGLSIGYWFWFKAPRRSTFIDQDDSSV